MKWEDLDATVQESILELLNQHLLTSADILQQDRCLLPMLMLPDSHQVMSLQAEDGNTDVDKAYRFVVEALKQEVFTYALFSYSTRIGLASGKETDAVKTCIFTAERIEVSFFTPYRLKGFLKKTIQMEKSIVFEVKNDILA